MSTPPLSPGARYAVVVAAFLALVFDGVELGLMPVASLSVSKSLLGDAFTPTLGGDGYVLLYEGHAGTGAARSPDGIAWKDRGLVIQLSGRDADRYGQVTPHLVRAEKGWQVFAGAASRKTWDGNILTAFPLVTLPQIGGPAIR